MTERTLSDRYRLENRIGAGGMAIVYSGVDTVLRRRVAIKILRAQFAEDQDFVKRFYFEAQHAAKLSHPNVVNIYDVGREGETYYIVMELIDGATLAEMIESDGRLPEPVAIEFAAQICAGLAYAHRQGLLHRDIKPANILVTKDDVVKLSDFGIARAVTTQTVTVTQPGLVMGSVYYLSPEQAQGHELAETSDLYSLGVVLFQMLSGTLPYTGESPVTVALKHVSNPIPPLETDGAIGVSPALTAIVRKLLQKDPAARFHSATEVATALREAREHPLVTTPFDVPSNGSLPEVASLVRTIPNPKPRPSRFPDRQQATRARPVVPSDGYDDDDVEPRPFLRFSRLPLYVYVIALAAAIFAGYALFNRGSLFGPPTPIALENLVGRSTDDAEKALGSAGLGYNVVAQASETVPKDKVVKQDPAPNALVAPHSVVQLFVSSGLPIVEMTDLRQYTLADAQRILRAGKLIAKITPKYDGKTPKDIVLSQMPPPGTKLPIHSTVALVVSKGAQPVAVPDLVTLMVNDAAQSLAKRGLKLEISERVPNDNIDPDVVVSQNPLGGVHVDPGSTVTVVVSAGPPSLGVPDVGGRSLAEAIAALQGAGLSYRLNYVVDASAPTGTVMQQDPAPSAQARKGSSITLVVAVPGVVPDVTNMSIDQARGVLSNAGYALGTVIYGAPGETGKVVRSEPDAGGQLRPGGSVVLHVAGNAPQ
jgi:serine/threonine-protein kinase